MELLPYNVYARQCPTRAALDRIADKWTSLIVGVLADRPHRFGQLRRAVDGISQKVLSQTLRSLERDGLVSRKVCPTVPVTVEYSLTALGRTLVAPLAAIREWAEAHVEEVLAARSAAAARRADGDAAYLSRRATASMPASADGGPAATAIARSARAATITP